MIDLAPEDLSEIKRILSEHVPGCEVRAYGSRVKHRARRFSDLDLALVDRKAIERDRLSDLKQRLAESDLPITVDIVDWNAIPDSFRTIIEDCYEVIQ